MNTYYVRIPLLLLIIVSFNLHAQNIPNSRKADWEKAGLVATIGQPVNTVNFITAGGDPSGTLTCDSALSSIISNTGSGQSSIYFPNGTYLFNSPIFLINNISMIGQSADSTILRFHLNGAGDLISIKGVGATTDTFTMGFAAYKNNSFLNFSNDTSIRSLNPGDFLKLIDNDSSKITSAFGMNSSGQIVRVDFIRNDSIFLKSKLRRNYLLSDQPYIVKIDMIENATVENLTVERLDSASGISSNIDIDYAFNCHIKCIKSFNCNFAHIEVSNSTNIEIEGSYFQDAFEYGTGGRAYGVSLQYTSGECLLYNNIFNHLRHSILLQTGANGNVVGYNYSINPFWNQPNLPSDAAGDLVLHGNYPYANLFEGNIIQNIIIDNSHGINGPFNTFFRNRANLYGIVMNQSPATDSTNFLGNEVTNNGFLKGNYLLFGNGHLEYGNNIKGSITPSGTGNLPISSYYLSVTPNYYSSNSQWPPIGPPNSINSNNIETDNNFSNGILTECQNTLTTSIPVEVSNRTNHSITVYPNPFDNYINYSLQNTSIHVEEVSLFSIEGKLIGKVIKPDKTINFRPNKKGVFIVEFKLSDKVVVRKKLMRG